MHSHFFSLVIPTYNRASLIGKTLQSALDQTFCSFEIIVVDDGSTDETEKVIKQFQSDHIFYYKKENGERGASRNFGWENARGEYITFLDSDDLLYPNHLEEAYNFLSNKKEVVCYAQSYEIKNALNGHIIATGHHFPQPTVNKEILSGNFLSCFGVFIKKDIYPTLKFNADRKFAGTEDWLLWLQLSARYPFYYNNTVTGALVEHKDRSVLSYKEDGLLYRTHMLRQKLIEDKAFVSAFGYKRVKKIYAHMLSYTSLHLVMSNKKAKAIRYWLKAISVNSREIFTKRSLSITKKILSS